MRCVAIVGDGEVIKQIHLDFAQFEVHDLEVFDEMVRFGGAREGHAAVLETPSDEDLSGCPSVATSHDLHDPIIQQSAVLEWAGSLNNNTVAVTKVNCILGWEPGVDLLMLARSKSGEGRDDLRQSD